MNNLSRVAICVLAAGAALPAFAQQQTDVQMKPYAVIDYSHVFADDVRQSRGGNGFDLGVGTALSKHWGVELDGFYNKFSGSPHSYREYGFKGDGQYYFSRDRKFSPYAGVGLGGIQTDETNQATVKAPFGMFADAGVGAKTFFTVAGHDVGVRADLRYRWTRPRLENGPYTLREPVLRVGLVLPFDLPAHRAAAAPVVAAAAMPTAAPQAAAPPKPKCAQPAPHGFKVDANGCIIQQDVVLRGVNFEYNSDRLTAPSQETLDELATTLNGQPELNVEIAGYTDSRGSAAYNLRLSRERAESVRSYLISKGVKGSSLVAKGYGKAKPIASNDTNEGRTENRRVEFVVLNKPADLKVTSEGSTEQSKAAAEERARAKAKAKVEHKKHKKHKHKK
ncbi:MAG: OmpA family protein [Stenotrophobium sp.]